MKRMPISIFGTPDPRWFSRTKKKMADEQLELFDSFFIPNLGWDDEEAPSSGWKKENKNEEAKTNQGRETCWKCGAKTIKVDTGMFSVYDICPKCKI